MTVKRRLNRITLLAKRQWKKTKSLLSKISKPRQKVILYSSICLIAIIFGVMILSRGRGKQINASENTLIDELPVGITYDLPGLHPDQRDKRFGVIAMTVQEVRKLSEVKVNGEPVNIPSDKAFLSVTLELQNKTNVNLGFYARDYFRLLVDGKPYAPQFYNSGMSIAPVSVKSDRVAFIIDRDARDIKLQVGDLVKPSELLEFSFSK